MRGLRLGALGGVLLLLAGCGSGGFSGLYNSALPGGADLGDNPYQITAQFSNVLDLVPQAAVKVNDVPVGRVDSVDLSQDTKSAVVTLSVNGDVKLPDNADAELRQSSLLGEKFVELSAPEDKPPKGHLSDGAAIPLSRTNRNVEVEEVLGALSMLLNGGGVQQMQNITQELNTALSGNEAQARALLSRVDELATELDGQKGDIIRAIDGLNRLSSTLVSQEAQLTNALDNLAPGISVVAQQREQLVGMLQSLQTLSDVAVDTVNQSKEQVVANLRALTPTLRKLAEAGQDLPTALKILPTYPFPDVARDVIKGDYANVRARIDLNFDGILENIMNSGEPIIQLPGGEGTGAEGAIPFNGGEPPPSLPLPPTTPPEQQQPPPPDQPEENTGRTQQGGVVDGVDQLLGTLLGGG